MVLVIPISLTGQAGKCLKQTAEHKEVLFSQKGCSAERTTVTQMQMALSDSHAVSHRQALNKELGHLGE